MAVLAVVEAVGGDLAAAGLALADLGGLKGRGERHHYRGRWRGSAADRRKLQRQSGIDGGDAGEPGQEQLDGRRIAVLGPMRELGAEADAMHAALADPVRAAGVERLILVGDEMRGLARGAGRRNRVDRADDVEQLRGWCRRYWRRATWCWSRRRNSIGLAALVERVAGSRLMLICHRRAAWISRNPQPDPLHQLSGRVRRARPR